MAKEKFDRSKPHINIGQIGSIDHSKTTLTAALTKTLAKQQQGEYDKIDQKEDTPKEDQKGITINNKTHKD